MKNPVARSLDAAALAMLALSLFSFSAFATDNIYTSPVSGSWGTAGNWSAGTPTNGEDILITNLPAKTVTVDSTAPTNSLTVNSLTVGAGVITGNPTEHPHARTVR